MQCLRVWLFTIWLCIISVNHSAVASPVDTLNVEASPVDTLKVDNKTVADLNTAESKHDEAEVSERDNEAGYLRRANEKGGDAYQHFESFHDKDGDAYGYEKHEAFGNANKGESLNDGKDKDEGSHYTYVQELGDKPKYQKYQGHNDDPGKSTHNNYHYSYNSDDDDDNDKKKSHYSSSYSEHPKKDEDNDEGEDKPHYSSNYSEETRKDDGSDEDDEDNNSTDEEKTTHFNYKIVSDDYAEDDGHGDINSKGNGNDKGYGYHFGPGDKNTKVNYSIKKSDYIIRDDEDDNEDEGEVSENEGGEDEGSEEDEDDNVIVKNQKLNDDQGQAKDAKSYSTYTTFSSAEGDNEDDDDEKEEEEEDNKKPLPVKKQPLQKHVVRYENTYAKPDNNKPSNKIVVNEETEENSETNDDNNGHVNEDVELHQPAKPEPTREHRTQYIVQNVHPQSTPQVFIQPSKPTVIVQEHHSGYKVEESSGDKASDDTGKGHAGSVSTHLYEIFVTHDTGKSNGGGGGGGDGDGGDAKESEEDGGDGNGKSENLVIEKSQKLNDKPNASDNGAYNINIKYGKKKASAKNGKKGYRKRKGNLKKRKIVKPHKYEVEEYTDSEDEPKQSAVTTKVTPSPQHRESIVAGKESSPQHHRDSDDYSNGQQFLYASEADSDAYYW